MRRKQLKKPDAVYLVATHEECDCDGRCCCDAEPGYRVLRTKKELTRFLRNSDQENLTVHVYSFKETVKLQARLVDLSTGREVL